MLAVSRAADKRTSTVDSTVEPVITNNKDSKDESNGQNVFCHTVIGVREGIKEGITNIIGREITNPILRTKDNSDFKLVDQYHIHQLFTAIIEGAEITESTNIPRQFVNITGTIFDWRETVVTNIKLMKYISEKLLGCGV